MLLWKFKEKPETRYGFPCEAFRWVIGTEFSIENGFNFGIYHQYKFKSDKKWYTSHTAVYEIRINQHLSFGQQHVYYDGPHCSYSFGPFHYNCGGGFRTNWCKKCMPDDK